MTLTDLGLVRLSYLILEREKQAHWQRIVTKEFIQLASLVPRLQEGLTVYRDQEFSADMGSRARKRIEDVRILRAAQFPEEPNMGGTRERLKAWAMGYLGTHKTCRLPQEALRGN